MPTLTHSERIRRVALLCHHFVRNYTYYKLIPATNTTEFWKTMRGNCLDVAVLEWCKLFADKDDRHGWRKIVTDKKRFESDLLAHLKVTSKEFADFVGSTRFYRDKFLAHLDSEKTMNIPHLGLAEKSADFYHAYIVAHEGTGVKWGKLNDLSRYQAWTEAEASKDLAKC